MKYVYLHSQNIREIIIINIILNISFKLNCFPSRVSKFEIFNKSILDLIVM